MWVIWRRPQTFGFLKIRFKTNGCQFSIYWGGGRGEASPPQKKSFTEKNLQLFQIKIFFDDDFKESVKVTNV